MLGEIRASHRDVEHRHMVAWEAEFLGLEAELLMRCVNGVLSVALRMLSISGAELVTWCSL